MAGEKGAFREVLPKAGLLYTQEAPELVRARKHNVYFYHYHSFSSEVSWVAAQLWFVKA